MVKFYKVALFSLLLAVAPILALAATLSIVPGSGTYEVGDTVTIQEIVSSGVSLNAISSKIQVSPTFFAIQSVSKVGSILNFWVSEPSFDKSSGIVNLEGVALSGFQGSSGTVATIKLKTLKSGSGKIAFQSGQILANNGQGTDITDNLAGAAFTIIEAANKKPAEQPANKPAEQPAEATEQPQPLRSLKAPEIISSTKYGVPSVIGTSDYPKAQVLLSFVAKDGSKIVITGIADADGSFNLVVPNSFKHGDYEVSAIMVREDKTSSEKSNIITLKIGSIFSDAGREIIWLVAFLILVILYLLARIYRHFGKDGSIHRRLKSEARKAEDIAHKSFDVLREDISDYEDEKSPASRKKMASEIKKDISDAEKVISKEIKDIESA
jgi:hypothetical protein